MSDSIEEIEKEIDKLQQKVYTCSMRERHKEIFLNFKIACLKYKLRSLKNVREDQ